jgi:hypothetical protein
MNIHGFTGGKVNILGDHSIDHSKKKVYLNMCAIPNGFRDRAVWMYSWKLLIRKRYYVLFLIFIVQVTNLLVCNKFLKIPPSTSLRFAARVRTWRVARLSSSWRSFIRAIEQFVPCVYFSYVLTLHSSSNPINKNLMGLGLEILVAR